MSRIGYSVNAKNRIYVPIELSVNPWCGENLVSGGTGIGRCFGREREVIVPMQSEMFCKSCFESSGHLEKLTLETGSKLKRIYHSEPSLCESLPSARFCDNVESGSERLEACESSLPRCCSLKSIRILSTGTLHGARYFHISRRTHPCNHNRDQCMVTSNECQKATTITIGKDNRNTGESTSEVFDVCD
jgi:hypothetical protein